VEKFSSPELFFVGKILSNVSITLLIMYLFKLCLLGSIFVDYMCVAAYLPPLDFLIYWKILSDNPLDFIGNYCNVTFSFLISLASLLFFWLVWVKFCHSHLVFQRINCFIDSLYHSFGLHFIKKWISVQIFIIPFHLFILCFTYSCFSKSLRYTSKLFICWFLMQSLMLNSVTYSYKFPF
jgi:hypothetical protein